MLAASEAPPERHFLQPRLLIPAKRHMGTPHVAKIVANFVFEKYFVFFLSDMFRSATFSILFGIPIGTVGWGGPCRVPPGALPDAPWVLPDVPETLPDAPGRARSGQEAHNCSKSCDDGVL